mgnify:CR=1 FL=1
MKHLTAVCLLLGTLAAFVALMLLLRSLRRIA